MTVDFRIKLLVLVTFAVAVALGCGARPSSRQVGDLEPREHAESVLEPSTPPPPPVCQVADLSELLACDRAVLTPQQRPLAELDSACSSAREQEAWGVAADTCMAAYEAGPAGEQGLERLGWALDCRGRAQAQGRRDFGDSPGFRRVELDEEDRRIEAALRHAVCQLDAGRERGELLYRLARLWYDHSEFERSAAAFEAVFEDIAGPEIAEPVDGLELATYAATLHLDALVLRTQQAPELSDSCAELFRDAVGTYEARFCGRHEGACDQMQAIRCSLDASDAQAVFEEGDHGEARRRWEALATDSVCGYGCSGIDWLHNALVAARAAGDATSVERIIGRLDECGVAPSDGEN